MRAGFKSSVVTSEACTIVVRDSVEFGDVLVGCWQRVVRVARVHGRVG